MTTICKPSTSYKRPTVPTLQRRIDPRITDDIAPWARVQSSAATVQPGTGGLGFAWPNAGLMPQLPSSRRELELNISSFGNPWALQNLPVRVVEATAATSDVRANPWDAQGRLELPSSFYPSPPLSHFDGSTATLQAVSHNEGIASSDGIEMGSSTSDLVQVSTRSTSSSEPTSRDRKRARELEHESTDRASKKHKPVILKFFVPAGTRARRDDPAITSAEHAFKARFMVPKGMRAKAEELDPDHVIITWLRQVAGTK